MATRYVTLPGDAVLPHLKTLSSSGARVQHLALMFCMSKVVLMLAVVHLCAQLIAHA